MSLDPKISTAPSVTTGRLSSKRVPSLKLPATFPASILEVTASTMSCNDQVFAEKSKDLVSRKENAPKVLPTQDCRVSQEKKPCIQVNTRELDRELYTRLSTLYTKHWWSVLYYFSLP